jgi:hypothetical protein
MAYCIDNLFRALEEIDEKNMQLGTIYYHVAAALSIRGKKCQPTEHDKTEILKCQTLLQFTETGMD